VGLVSAACLAETGNHVCCVDINEEVIHRLKNGDIHIYEPGLGEIVRRNIAGKRLFFTASLEEAMVDSMFIFNCVGTPPNPDGSCDLSAVFQAARQIGRHLNDYKIVVNKSTVPVGTADAMKEIIIEELKRRQVDIPFDVVSNPEFLKEGGAVNDFMKPDRIIIGTDNTETAELLSDLYAPYARSRDKLIVMGVRSAEMTKYAANCMLATKISFINEMANICENVGADIRDVRVGIGSDHRIGYHFIYPGLGYGGSCFPKDVKALIQTALDVDYQPSLLTAVEEVNYQQKFRMIEKIKTYFSDKGGAAGKTIAVWGLSFKANTDDIRDSSAIYLSAAMIEAGMRVRGYDPVAGENARAYFRGNPGFEIAADQYDMLDGADGLAVLTDWNQFRNPNFKMIRQKLNFPIVFDGRNLFPTSTISRFGLGCIRVGRPEVSPSAG
ncbi:MAG: UDP-glucose/GDP-mannose dehydrogenase family protein, partial [Desulfosalsimonadaceae bacterium]